MGAWQEQRNLLTIQMRYEQDICSREMIIEFNLSIKIEDHLNQTCLYLDSIRMSPTITWSPSICPLIWPTVNLECISECVLLLCFVYVISPPDICTHVFL